MSWLPEVLAFFAGGLVTVTACFAYAYRAMGIDIVPPKDEHETHLWTRASHVPPGTKLTSVGAARVGDIIFRNPPRALSDYFGEQLIFESICEARNLNGVFAAYVMADNSQRRECTCDERMFYDACLGTAVRGLIDDHRVRAQHPEPEPVPAPIKNMACH